MTQETKIFYSADDETYWKCNKECFIFDNDQFLEHLRRANYAGYRRGLEESKVNK